MERGLMHGKEIRIEAPESTYLPWFVFSEDDVVINDSFAYQLVESCLLKPVNDVMCLNVSGCMLPVPVDVVKEKDLARLLRLYMKADVHVIWNTPVEFDFLNVKVSDTQFVRKVDMRVNGKNIENYNGVCFFGQSGQFSANSAKRDDNKTYVSYQMNIYGINVASKVPFPVYIQSKDKVKLFDRNGNAISVSVEDLQEWHGKENFYMIFRIGYLKKSKDEQRDIFFVSVKLESVFVNKIQMANVV